MMTRSEPRHTESACCCSPPQRKPLWFAKQQLPVAACRWCAGRHWPRWKSDAAVIVVTGAHRDIVEKHIADLPLAHVSIRTGPTAWRRSITCGAGI